MEIDFDHYIKIYFDDEHEPAEIIEEVLRLVEEGYLSGAYPHWEIVSKDDPDEIYGDE